MLYFLSTIISVILYAIFDKDVYLILAGLFAIADSIGITVSNIATTLKNFVKHDKKNQN